MTDPVRAFKTDFGRFYSHPKFALERFRAKSALGALGAEIEFDPTNPYAPKPSITNVIGMMDKPWIAPFYSKQVATYAVENLDSLRYQVKMFGPQMAIGSLKSIPNRPHPNAAIGDEVHDAIDLWHSEGLEPAEPFSTTTAAAMYAQYRYFVTQVPVRVLRTEYTVWSYEYGYAGTGDLLWEVLEAFRSPEGVIIPPGVWVTDTKTGTAVHPEVAMQTAAIQHADVILDAQGNETPMPKAQHLGVLHVRPRSVKLHKIERGEESFRAFVGLKAAFDWRQFHAEATIQPPYKSQKPKEAK